MECAQCIETMYLLLRMYQIKTDMDRGPKKQFAAFMHTDF